MGEATAWRILATAALACMAAVVVASAFLRHLGAGESMAVAWAGPLASARMLHRVAATLVLSCAVVMTAWAWRRRGHDAPGVFGLAAGLLGTAVLLSGVGVMAGASRALPVVLVNLLGGLVMLALCARLALPASRRGVGHAAWLLFALVLLQAAGGAAAGATAPAACVGLSECGGFALLHRVSGAALACALLVFGLWARGRTHRRAAVVLCACATLALLLGALNAGIGGAAAPLLVVAHNALSAAALASLARLA